MAGRAATLCLQLVVFAILTRLLGQERFGDLSAALAALSIFAAVAEFGLTASLVINVDGDEKPHQLFATGLRASILTGALGLVLVIPGSYLLFPPEARHALWFLLPSGLVDILTVSLFAHWQRRLSFVRLAFASVLGQALTVTGLAILLVVGHRWSETSQLEAVGMSFLVASGAVVVALWPPTAARFRLLSAGWVSEVRSVLGSAVPLGIAGAISLLHVRADQVILAALGYRRGLGSYAVAYQILQGAVVGLGSIGYVGFSLMARGGHEERARHSRRAVALLCPLGVLGSFVMAFLAPVAVDMLGASRYVGAVRACRLLAPVVVLAVANTMAGRVLMVEGIGRLLSLVAGAALAVNVALCLVLIPILGIAGAATATVISEALGTAVVVTIAARRLRASQPVGLLGLSVLGTITSLLVADWAPGGMLLAVALGALTVVATVVLARSDWRDLREAASSESVAEPAE